MTELKLLASILAGSRLSYIGAAGFQLKIGEEYLTGQDIQETARKLLNKEFFRFAMRGAKYAVVTAKGMAALANMEVDPTGYIYDDPDYSTEIYVGTAFICRICGDGNADKDAVQAHIDAEHAEGHNDPDDDQDDQDDYRPGGIFGPPLETHTYYAPGYEPEESDADDLAEPGMDRPYNFDEPTEE